VKGIEFQSFNEKKNEKNIFTFTLVVATAQGTLCI